MFESRAVQPGNIVRVDIEDNDALYAAYMPFIENGGIFVDRKQLVDMHCSLGDHIHLLLHIKDENGRIPVHGRTVWVANRPAGRRPAGIGVQFRDDGETRKRLEGLLAERLASIEKTLTL